MIAELTGSLTRTGADYVVIDVGGVGYKVHAPLTVIAEMPPAGSEVKVYTFTYVKEDALMLYGFSDLEQQMMFELLLTVSGVGPKAALSALSVLPVEQIVDAIAADDFKALVRVPGVGAKSAQRITLELKDKVASLVWERRAERSVSRTEGGDIDDLVEGLVGLGYNKNDARDAAEEALQSVGDTTNTAALLRVSLKLLTKR